MGGFLWAAVFLAGGIAVWTAAPRDEAHPSPWRQTADPSGASAGLDSEIRASAGEPGILRLEWPSHPRARSYRLRFRGGDGAPLPPVTLEGTVFLYDLRSDVLDLPDSFEWEVAAVLRDGSEIVAAPRRHPQP
jgi:hypothetical protein